MLKKSNKESEEQALFLDNNYGFDIAVSSNVKRARELMRQASFKAYTSEKASSQSNQTRDVVEGLLVLMGRWDNGEYVDCIPNDDDDVFTSKLNVSGDDSMSKSCTNDLSIEAKTYTAAEDDDGSDE